MSISTVDLFKFNSKPAGIKKSKPYHGFSKLAIGEHQICNFKLVKNRFFNVESENSLKRILMVELEDQILFLPQIFASKLNDSSDLIKVINSDGVKRFLCFNGNNDDG